MNPFTTRSKVISLYNYHSYCTSIKSLMELEVKNIEFSKTLNETIKWICVNNKIDN